jgi:uncharacterized protein YkwD
VPVKLAFRSVALTAVIAVIAVLGLSGTASAQGCAGAGSTKLSKGQAGQVVLCLINQQRARRGLPGLGGNGTLARIAHVHARDIVRYQFIGHDSPAHGSLLQRVKRSGYGRNRRLTFGEILGAGMFKWSTPRSIVREWMKRRIHRTAILYPKFRYMGVGVVRGMPSHGRKRSGRSFVVTFAN